MTNLPDLTFWISRADHGPAAAVLVYVLILVPMLVGLMRGQGRAAQFLLAPFIALPVTVLGLLLVSSTARTLAGLAPLSMGPATFEWGGFVTLVLIGYGAGLAAARARDTVRVKRGTRIEDGRPHQRRRRHGHNGPLTLAGVPVPPLDETKHFKLIGTTGTGKSTAIRELLGAALARGDRAVIADPDAGYLNAFYRPERGDVILNPFDPRAHAWDLFGEIRSTYDVEQLARSLIPDHEGPDRIWRSYARTFFTAVCRTLYEAGTRDLAELYRLLTSASPEELRMVVRHTPAQPFLEEGNERMFGSIRSVTGSQLTAFEYLATQRAEPLSVRAWIRGDVTGQSSDSGRPQGRTPRLRGTGALFLPYQADQIAALRSIISTWMRLAIFERMSGSVTSEAHTRPTGPHANGARDAQHRLPCWFAVDELDALGQIDGLKDALARLRKFGGRCVLGFQSIAQVSTTYGHGEAQTIVENCGNTLILRCSASETGGTARFASRLIGEREVIRPQVSRSKSGGFLHDPRHSRSTSEQHVTEPAVLGSEIEQLPDLQGYLKLASKAEWLRVRMTVR